MDRRLVLVRHAKSSWDDPTAADHDRLLSIRGQEVLADMRTYLYRSDLRPQFAVCSTAARAVATFEGVRSCLPSDIETRFDVAIYESTSDQLISFITSLPVDCRCAMVVGHNPALKGVIESLVTVNDEMEGQPWSGKLPTGSIATLSFACGWDGLHAHGAQLQDLFVP